MILLVGDFEQSYNPDNSTINNSKYSGQYTRNPDGNGEDLLIAYFNNGSLDLSTNKNFNFQMYGPQDHLSYLSRTQIIMKFIHLILC